MIKVCEDAALMAEEKGISCEIIDLRWIKPWDEELVYESVKKTGSAIVVHEAPKTNGFGAELIASINENCFEYLYAPSIRVTQYDLHTPLALEKFTLPDK